MKHFLPSSVKFFALVLGCFLFCSVTDAQYVTIPDTTFVNWLNSNGFAGCLNGNQLDTTCSAVVSATGLYCSSVDIKDLTGVQYFKNLDTLECSSDSIYFIPALPPSLLYFNCGSNELDSLPALPSGLQTFYCPGNQLTSLPALPIGIRYIWCSQNQLISLPALPNALVELTTDGNQLLTLPALPTNLEFLYCQNNLLTALPALPSNLEVLYCYGNQLSTLPAIPSNLGTLYCDNNYLTALPALPSNMEYLSCGDNQISTLPVLPTQLNQFDCSRNLITIMPALPLGLEQLYCAHNQLTSLPTFPMYLYELDCSYNQLTVLPALTGDFLTLDCSNNQLTALPVLSGRLSSLTCGSNPITSIPALPSSLTSLKCNQTKIINIPTLPDSLYWFDCSNDSELTCLPELKTITWFFWGGSAITCFPDYGEIYNSTPPVYSLPLCNSVNTSSCPSYWNIAGQCFYDANNDCVFNSGDIGNQYVKVQLYSGGNLIQQIYSDTGGVYSFDLVPLGDYTVQIDTTNLPFTVECPANSQDSVSLTVSDSLSYNNNFAFKCRTEGFDVGVNSMINGYIVPRPNNTFTLSTVAGDMSELYGAHCAAGIGGTVQLFYSGPLKYVAPAGGALAPASVANNIVTWNIPDYGAVNDFIAFNLLFKIDSLAVPGTPVCFTANVNPTTGDYNPSNNTLTYCFPVVASLDPNEKEAYPAIIDSGGWLTYTVRFQNTGTASAINIRVVDTLDPNLDPSTFQLLTYSAKNIAQVFGDVVVFTFANINLPDSAVGDSVSRGFVQYRIRLIDSISPGATISNSASIYFDQNAPVITNTVYDSVVDNLCNVVYTDTTLSLFCGNSVAVGGNVYTATGNYVDTLQSSSGCDSIVTLNLTVNPDTLNQSGGLCTGDSTLFYGRWIYTAGTYDTILPGSPCDTVAILNLASIDPLAPTNLYDTICPNDSVRFDGNYLHASGSYTAHYSSVNGCDSIVVLRLTVNPSYNDTAYTNVCPNTPVYFDGNYYSNPGVYTDSLTTVNGCDSILTLNLSNYQTYVLNAYDTICSDGQVYFGGNYYNLPGAYTASLTSVNGCDSIVTLNLFVYPAYYDTTYESTCPNTGVYFNGSYYFGPGIYNVAYYSTINGCDSIITLNLSVYAAYNDTVYDTICSNESVYFDGNYYSTPGMYTDYLNTVNGCDSVLTLSLSNYPVYNDTLYDTTCLGSGVNFYGTYYTQAGFYTQQLNTVNGCDSSIILALALTGDTVHSTGGLCANDSAYFYGRWIYTPGTYDTILPGSPCDTVAILSLAVIDPLPPTNLFDTICANDSVRFNGNYLHTAGTYTAHYSAVNGCDSTVNLHLNVNSLDTTSLASSICYGDTFSFNGVGYTASGNYIARFTNASGCDSVSILHLSVASLLTTSLFDTICQGTSFSFKDSLFSISGSYHEMLTSSGGCDSIVTLNLNVLPQPTEPYITQQGNTLTSSFGFTYQWYLNDSLLAADTTASITATQSGNYQVEVTGGNNCGTLSAPFSFLLNNIIPLCCDFDAILYPNPNNGNFVLQFSDNTARNVSVTDVLGQVILPVIKVTGKHEFDLSHFAAGIYYLRITGTDNEQAVFRQVVVQK